MPTLSHKGLGTIPRRLLLAIARATVAPRRSSPPDDSANRRGSSSTTRTRMFIAWPPGKPEKTPRSEEIGSRFETDGLEPRRLKRPLDLLRAFRSHRIRQAKLVAVVLQLPEAFPYNRGNSPRATFSPRRSDVAFVAEMSLPSRKD